MARQSKNRKALLDAAIRCLEERGYARTTARDLVAASGTNLGAIGYHFGSKEALLNEALAECVRRWIDRLGEAATRSPTGTPSGDPARRLFDALSQSRPLAVSYLEAWTQAERSPELREQLAGHYRDFRMMTATLVESVAADERAAIGWRPEAVASLIIALVDGLMVQWLLDPEAVATGDGLTGSVRGLVATLEGLGAG